MVTIVDYGVGNLQSIRNMFKKAGFESEITSSSQGIESSTKLVLPGVGAFDTCVAKLKESGLLENLERKVLSERVPVLGVCVGMQLLFEQSEEGMLPGLGWLKGKVVRFKESALPKELKIPHMGWTDVVASGPTRLFENMFPDPRFYFVHSYHAEGVTSDTTLLMAHYGYDFVAGVEKGNVMGVQFHPEKSHKFGMRLLENFVRNY